MVPPTPEEQLQAAVDAATSNDLQRTLLLEIARRPEGVLLGPAVVALSEELGVQAAACNAALMELIALHVVIVDDDVATGERLLLADLEALNLPAELTARIVEASMPVSILGAPHSPPVVNRLRSDLATRDTPVYICFDIANPEDYEGLEDRAAHGRKTVILVANKRHVAENRRQLYEDALSHWASVLKDSGSLKRNVELRVLRRHHPELTGSALTDSEGRVRLRSTQPLAAQAGSIVGVAAGSAVYAILADAYRAQLVASDPLRRVWPLEWARSRVPVRYVLAVGALLIAVALAGTAGAVATVVGSYLVNLASGWAPLQGLLSPGPRELF